MNLSSNAKRQKLEQELHVTFIRDVLTLKFVQPDSDATDGLQELTVIQPKFVHHIFGDDEVLHGYEELQIQLWISIESFHGFLEIQYKSRSPKADDIRQKLKRYFEYEFLETKEELQTQIRQQPMLMEDQLGQIMIPRIDFMDGELLITCNQLSTASECLKELHYRLEPFLGFFIDGFQCIDTSDPDWLIFSVFYIQSSSIRLIGYATVYKFFAYPSKSRFRIAQMFVLPTYQQQGVGRPMLEAIMHYVNEQGGEDLSVEDPTNAMLYLIQSFHVANLKNNDWIKTIKDQKMTSSQNQDGSKQQFMLSKTELNQIHCELKIPYKEIALLWFVYLLIESSEDPDTTTTILQFLTETLEASLKPVVHEGKAIFQELGSDGVPSDNFMMLKCNNWSLVQSREPEQDTGLNSETLKRENVFVSFPVLESKEQETTQELISKKLEFVLHCVEDFKQR